MSAQRYLAIALGTTLLAALAIALANWSVDPLALRDSALAAKPSAAPRSAGSANFWHKVFAVTRLRPATVILGTSRAEGGLDAAHPGFAPGAQPVFNLGLGGVSIDQIRMLLMHAQHTRRLTQVVIGLDPESFLDVGRSDFDPAVLTGFKESEAQWLSMLRINLSWRALAATVGGWRAPQANPGEALRFAETGVTRARVAELEGQRGLFWAAEFNNFYFRLPLLFPRPDSGGQWNSDPRRVRALGAFRELLRYARAEGIDLRLFISPVHARYLEWYRRVGWWPWFESWKRALVEALAQEAGGRPGASAFPLWDFSTYNSVTMESLPRLGDIETSMRWYVESSHYSREHGTLILDRVLGHTGRQAPDPGEYGTLIDTRNINAQLERTRRDALRYGALFPAELQEIAEMVRIIRRDSRR